MEPEDIQSLHTTIQLTSQLTREQIPVVIKLLTFTTFAAGGFAFLTFWLLWIDVKLSKLNKIIENLTNDDNKTNTK